MARSKVTTPSGKKVTPKKKRDTKARASVKITQRKDGDFDVVKRNDNDPTVTYTERDKRKKVKIPLKYKKPKPPKVISRTKNFIEYESTSKLKEYKTKSAAAKAKAEKARTKAGLPSHKKNKDYNKKKPPEKSYSNAAKNPGGHILGIPKKEKLNKKDTAAYRAYLRNNR